MAEVEEEEEEEEETGDDEAETEGEEVGGGECDLGGGVWRKEWRWEEDVGEREYWE